MTPTEKEKKLNELVEELIAEVGNEYRDTIMFIVKMTAYLISTKEVDKEKLKEIYDFMFDINKTN